MFDPTQNEPKILQKWQELGLRNKIQEKNKGGKQFYFLQGPPYTSGRIHTGHAWNHALKDMVLKYQKMKGRNVFDRAGYDMHGLPTESKVVAKLGLSSKDEIETYGYEKFVTECLNFCKEHAALMNEDFKRLGVDMDFDNAYMPISREYIDGIWWLIKKLDEKGRLYEGFRTVHWDWKDETALTKHELTYKSVTDKSIFVRFPLEKDFEGQAANLIIWTTTPWTIPLNLAVMVNPDLEYDYVQVEWNGKKEVWVVAHDLAGVFIQGVIGQKVNVLKTVKGSELAGLKYVHPLNDIMGEQYKEVAQTGKRAQEHIHSVILSADHVDTSAGTGLVHCAPGCGPEDFEVGWKHGLPAFNVLDEKGTYPDNVGPLSNRQAIPDNVKFIDDLEERNALVASSPVEHDYPHAERSGAPVCFRATKQWFWKVEDLKEKMIAANDQTHWVPKAGYNSFSRWLENLRDNSITKQRPWGTPVPIWRNIDDESDYIVIGSIKELEELTGKENIEPHKPWVDIDFVKNGKTYRRIPDVLDVWIDAGSASWNALNFPKDEEQFNKLFPADFICEGTDQIRGWFNLLMVASIAAFDKPCFKAVYMHGMVTDVDGVKMSKSLGNIISPYEIIDKYGADTLRYYFSKTKAGEDISFAWDEIGLHNRNLRVLYNTVALFTQNVELAKIDGDDVSNITTLANKEDFDLVDKYILSKMHKTLQEVNDAYESYELYKIATLIDSLFLDISRVYVQQKRDALADGGKQRAHVLQVMYACLEPTLRMFATIAPFISDELYTSLYQHLDGQPHESVHLTEFPSADISFVDEEVESDYAVLERTVSDILNVREQIKRNQRFPLMAAELLASSEQHMKALERIKQDIAVATNTKSVTVVQSTDKQTVTIKPNYRNLGKKHGQQTADVAKHITTLDKAEIEQLQSGKAVTTVFDNNEIQVTHDDVNFQYAFKEGFAGTKNVIVSTETNDELEKEGLARETMRRLQSMRKDAGLKKHEKISINYNAEGLLAKAIDQHSELIKSKCGLEQLNKIDADTTKDNIKKIGFYATIGD